MQLIQLRKYGPSHLTPNTYILLWSFLLVSVVCALLGQPDFTDRVSIVFNLVSHFTTSLLAALLTMSSSFIATYHAFLL